MSARRHFLATGHRDRLLRRFVVSPPLEDPEDRPGRLDLQHAGISRSTVANLRGGFADRRILNRPGSKIFLPVALAYSSATTGSSSVPRLTASFWLRPSGSVGRQRSAHRAIRLFHGLSPIAVHESDPLGTSMLSSSHSSRLDAVRSTHSFIWSPSGSTTGIG